MVTLCLKVLFPVRFLNGKTGLDSFIYVYTEHLFILHKKVNASLTIQFLIRFSNGLYHSISSLVFKWFTSLDRSIQKKILFITLSLVNSLVNIKTQDKNVQFLNGLPSWFNHSKNRQMLQIWNGFTIKWLESEICSIYVQFLNGCPIWLPDKSCFQVVTVQIQWGSEFGTSPVIKWSISTGEG
jgi:hypothetical protein